MAQQKLVNYLRTHRRKSGLSQREIAALLAYASEDPVRRHEHAINVPPLHVVLAYQAIFQVPISDLFPGIYQKVEETIHARLAEMESMLQQKSASDRDAHATARKLEWMWARRNGIEI